MTVVVCNFTPVVWQDYRLGVPQAGSYRVTLNTDEVQYGGSGAAPATGMLSAQDIPWHGKLGSILIQLPSLATVFF